MRLLCPVSCVLCVPLSLSAIAAYAYHMPLPGLLGLEQPLIKNDGGEKLAAVDEMRVPELRSELSKRTLDTAGLKAQLVERLKTAIKGPSSSGDGKKKAAASSP